jgi:hypothetical protein
MVIKLKTFCKLIFFIENVKLKTEQTWLAQPSVCFTFFKNANLFISRFFIQGFFDDVLAGSLFVVDFFSRSSVKLTKPKWDC